MRSRLFLTTKTLADSPGKYISDLIKKGQLIFTLRSFTRTGMVIKLNVRSLHSHVLVKNYHSSSTRLSFKLQCGATLARQFAFSHWDRGQRTADQDIAQCAKTLNAPLILCPPPASALMHARFYCKSDIRKSFYNITKIMTIAGHRTRGERQSLWRGIKNRSVAEK